MMDEKLREKMGEVAIRIARAVHYENAGTIEFLVDAEQTFYFLEMNTRLQVEHPVTEAVTGVDLVIEQFRIAAGEKLSLHQEEIQMRGWAMECRVYAEDPDRMMPSTGVIRRLQEPQGPGVRLDSGIYPGWEVSIHYDPLLAKLITYGSDRGQAIARMKRALREYRIVGIKNNLPFFVELLSDCEFTAGHTHTGFIEGMQRHAGTPQEIAPSLFHFHALAAALAYADTIDHSAPAAIDTESAWKRSGRPGFVAAPRR
jgi:acetyl/propionyl-CoA carboxylase alpha subunit